MLSFQSFHQQVDLLLQVNLTGQSSQAVRVRMPGPQALPNCPHRPSWRRALRSGQAVWCLLALPVEQRTLIKPRGWQPSYRSFWVGLASEVVFPWARPPHIQEALFLVLPDDGPLQACPLHSSSVEDGDGEVRESAGELWPRVQGWGGHGGREENRAGEETCPKKHGSAWFVFLKLVGVSFWGEGRF